MKITSWSEADAAWHAAVPRNLIVSQPERFVPVQTSDAVALRHEDAWVSWATSPAVALELREWLNTHGVKADIWRDLSGYDPDCDLVVVTKGRIEEPVEVTS